MPDDSGNQGVDISPLHRELDRLKSSLCRCQHQGTCVACRGFEMLREQSQMVIAAASQPVLMQVAQEAAVNDLMGRLGGMQETLQGKINEDGELQDLMARFLQRLQDDLGGPEGMQQLADSLGFPSPSAAPEKPAYDDLPADQRAKPSDEEKDS